MFSSLYFSLFVLALAVVGVITKPKNNVAKVLLIANVCLVCINVAILQGKVENLQEKIEVSGKNYE